MILVTELAFLRSKRHYCEARDDEVQLLCVRLKE